MALQSKKQRIGEIVERQAELFLYNNGLRVIDRNYRCKAGEIDLVMMDGDTIVFVEVRYRQSKLYGDSAASVTRTKQQRLIRTAAYYLLTKNKNNAPCRFDVMAAQGENSKTVCFDWIQNAFETF